MCGTTALQADRGDLMSKMIWTLNRIRKMRLAEYPYRGHQMARKLADRFFPDGARQIPPCDDDRMNIPRQDISWIESCFPNIRPRILEDAGKILEHRFGIFGIEADFGNPIDWHLDPKSGKSWPLKFWGDIDDKDGETIGGIKFAWELNRLNHLPRLAIAFALTEDLRFKEEIFLQLESWLAANPYPTGINWIMGIELGIRIVNLVYSLRFLGTEDLTDRQKKTVLSFIAIHARHLSRYPSRYSSAANHAIAEALGLYVAGSYFPGFRESEKWKRTGRDIMIREVERQIYPDGGSFEHSLSYLQFVLEQVLVFALACRETEAEVPGNIEERLQESLDFLARLRDPNGNVPLIGDGDDSHVLKLGFELLDNSPWLLNTGAILFDRPEWLSENAAFDQKTAFLLGEKALAEWRRLESGEKLPGFGSVYFPDSGIAVIRGETPKELLFVGDSGRLGAEPLGAHGHADALSIWLSVGGSPVFVDPGTYLFHGGGMWRNYFRSTAAHNTIRVDGLDQAEILSDFMYKKFYGIIDPHFADIGDTITWSAGHNGYCRLKDPVIHRRFALYDKRDDGLEIEDVLQCRGRHLVESRFHFHPALSVAQAGDVYRIVGNGVALEFCVDRKWTQRKLLKGSLDPMAGWYSPSFNVLQETWSLVLSAWIEGVTAFSYSMMIGASGQGLE